MAAIEVQKNNMKDERNVIVCHNKVPYKNVKFK